MTKCCLQILKTNYLTLWMKNYWGLEDYLGIQLAFKAFKFVKMIGI